jgi:hypothetical protein
MRTRVDGRRYANQHDARSAACIKGHAPQTRDIYPTAGEPGRGHVLMFPLESAVWLPDCSHRSAAEEEPLRSGYLLGGVSGEWHTVKAELLWYSGGAVPSLTRLGQQRHR